MFLENKATVLMDTTVRVRVFDRRTC